MKKSFGSIVLALGAIAIFFLIASGKSSTNLILPILGAICIVYGIIGVVNVVKANEDPNNHQVQSMSMPVMELLLGAFLMMIGIIDGIGLTLPENFWNYCLIFIVAIAVVWAVVRGHNNRK